MEDVVVEPVAEHELNVAHDTEVTVLVIVPVMLKGSKVEQSVAVAVPQDDVELLDGSVLEGLSLFLSGSFFGGLGL